MFNNSDITSQPLFYLFIAATILLTLGYSWGRRRNKKIYLSALNALVDTLKPKDQTFTNIGGLTGYHTNLIPKKNRYIKRVDATITLLPRQSWLYYPISKLIRKFDRLFVTISLAKDTNQDLTEGHLIEKDFADFRTQKIENPADFQQDQIRWGNKQFLLYTKDDTLKKAFTELIRTTADPLCLRHIAIVPALNRAFLFMIPKTGQVAALFPRLYRWVENLVR